VTYPTFDISLKDLIGNDPAAWASFVSNEPIRSVQREDVDLATVAANADSVLRVQVAGGAYLLNLELQSSHDASLPDRLGLYSTLLTHRVGLTVRSVVILLRREANARVLTGLLERQWPGASQPYWRFEYEVIALWTQSLERLLSGPVSLVPLAPLTDEAAANLPQSVERAIQRVRRDLPRDRSDIMETALFVLLGLRYDPDAIGRLLMGVPAVQESSVYRLFEQREAQGEARGLVSGQATGLREMVVFAGRKRLGPPPAEFLAALERIADHDQLRALADKAFEATSWAEVLA
jgi:predicted transposase YdaD